MIRGTDTQSEPEQPGLMQPGMTGGKDEIMSDWDKVKQWVSEDGYIPKNISMDEFIANILSQYKSDLEYDNCPVESWPLENWYETLVDVGCFDYIAE